MTKPVCITSLSRTQKEKKHLHVSRPLLLLCYMWCIVYWYYCLVNLAQIQPYQPSTSNLTNWSKMDVCLCGDVTVAIDPVNGNQGYDLAAWHCKSVIDRLELIHAVIVKGFSYWCLSMSALKTLTSGVKVNLKRVQSFLVRSCVCTLRRLCSFFWCGKKKLDLVARHHSTMSWIDLSSLGMQSLPRSL